MREVLVKQLREDGIEWWETSYTEGKKSIRSKKTAGRILAMKDAYWLSMGRVSRVTIQLLEKK